MTSPSPFFKVLVLLIWVTSAIQIQAQDPLNVFRTKGKCGYKNGNEEVVVPAQYDECRDCFLGPDFKIVISGGEKNTKISKGWIGGKWGVIHSSGKIIVPVEYDYINYLDEKAQGIIMAVSEGKYSFYDSTGKLVLPIADEISLSDYAKSISLSKASYYVRGFIPYKLNNKYGVVDFKGNKLIEPTCECISNFRDERAKSKELSIYSCNGKLGILYSNGTVLPPVFDAFYDAKWGNKLEVSDFNSSKKLECSFSISPNSTARFIYGVIGDTLHLFNHDGKLIPKEFLYNNQIVNDKFIISEINEKFGVIDQNGEVFIPYNYENIQHASTNEYLSEDRKTLFLAKYEGRWGAFSGDSGNVTIPFIYDELKVDYKNKYCAAFAGKKGKEWILFDGKHQYKSDWMEGNFVDNNRGWGITKAENDWIYVLDGNCKLDYKSKTGTSSSPSPIQQEVGKLADKLKQELACPTCYDCKGSGIDSKKEYMLEKCHCCEGLGKYTVRYGYGSNATYEKYSCFCCTGSGKKTVVAPKKPCFTCKGKGCIPKE